MSDEDEEKKTTTMTAEETLARALAEAEADEAIARIEKMSDEEIAKELADAGIDIEEERRLMAEHLKTTYGLDVDAPKEAKKEADVVPIANARGRERGGRAAWIGLAVAAAVAAAIAWQTSKREIAPSQQVARPDPPPSQPAPSATAPGGDTRDLVATPPPLPPPSTSPCRPLAWKEGGLVAEEETFDGVVRRGRSAGANGQEESSLVLVLDAPLCIDRGEPVKEVAVVTGVDPETRGPGPSLAPLLGRKVTLDGEPTAPRGAHGDGPLVLVVKKARPR